MRIEHWDVATQQGRVAARNMLGKFQPGKAHALLFHGANARVGTAMRGSWVVRNRCVVKYCSPIALNTKSCPN